MPHFSKTRPPAVHLDQLNPLMRRPSRRSGLSDDELERRLDAIAESYERE